MKNYSCRKSNCVRIDFYCTAVYNDIDVNRWDSVVYLFK